MMSCASCHKKFEPLGYVSERLSPLGQFRLKDEAGALTGEKVELENGRTVQTLSELGLELSGNPMIGYCLSQNLVKYALRGSYLSSESIKCQTENSVYEAYQAGNSLKDYLEAVILSPSFARKMEKK